MTSRRRSRRLLPVCSAVAAAVLAYAVGLPASAAPPVGGYVRTDLRTGSTDLPHSFRVSDTGNPVNASGLVAGSTTVGDFRPSTDAGLYDLQTGTWTDLGLFRFGNESQAADVNAGGDAVGAAGVDLGPGAPTRAFLWTRERPTLHDLGSLDPDDRQSGATAVNDHGVVVGWTYTPDSGYSGHAFLWDPEVAPVRMRDLGTLGGVDSVAYGISNAGVVVGSATTRRRVVRPVAWSAGTHAIADLGTLPGYDSGIARDVNDRGFVVGENFNAATPTLRRAVIWNPVTRAVTALPTPTGRGSAAYAINYHGVIVGRVDVTSADPTLSNDFQAAVWNACTPLTLLSGDYTIATGITRRERIVGVSDSSWIKAGPCT